MAKIIVLFNKPTDTQEFNEWYWKEHVPLAKQMPGIKKYTVNKVVGGPRGEPAYYQVVEIEFENMETLKKALESAASKESGRQAWKKTAGGMTFLYAESKEA